METMATATKPYVSNRTPMKKGLASLRAAQRGQRELRLGYSLWHWLHVVFMGGVSFGNQTKRRLPELFKTFLAGQYFLSRESNGRNRLFISVSQELAGAHCHTNRTVV